MLLFQKCAEMNNKKIKLAREQLDLVMRGFEFLKRMPAPRKGWIRAVRDTLGMSARQLAERLGIKQQRVARMERDEVAGRVTIRTMQHAAEAMDCVFVYGIIARDSLEEIVRRRAEIVARRRMARSNQTMKLEAQGLGREEQEEMFKRLVDEIVETLPKTLWDEP